MELTFVRNIREEKKKEKKKRKKKRETNVITAKHIRVKIINTGEKRDVHVYEYV